MKKNMGNTDRFLRLLGSATLITLFFSDILKGNWGFAALGLGIILLLTALTRFCPLYLPFHINTCNE